MMVMMAILWSCHCFFSVPICRVKVEALFEALSDKLIGCGQACLRRLSTLVMEDMAENLSQVFTPAWLGDRLEGNAEDFSTDEPSEQISVALATISDYLIDLNDFLVPFWSSRLVDFLLEVLVTKYFKLVMKVRDATPLPEVKADPEIDTGEGGDNVPGSPKGSKGPKRGLLRQMSSKMMSSARDLSKAAERVADSVSVTVSQSLSRGGLRASEQAVALIQQDVAAIEEFFGDKTDQAEAYTKILVSLCD